MQIRQLALAATAVMVGSYLALGQTGEVYSLNVVGFQKLEVKDSTKKYSLVATPFETEDPNINSVISTQLTGGTSYQSADNIMMWDPTNQQYLKYFLVGEIGDPYWDHKWYDVQTDDIATNTDILPGQGFWVRSRQVYTQIVVVAGDVVSADAFTNQIYPGFNLISYPYAQPIDINQTTFTNGGTGGTSFQSSDNLYLWNPTNQVYEKYFLIGEIGDPYFDHKWYDVQRDDVATNVYLDPAAGFWYRHRGTGFAWIEPKPYTEP